MALNLYWKWKSEPDQWLLQWTLPGRDVWKKGYMAWLMVLQCGDVIFNSFYFFKNNFIFFLFLLNFVPLGGGAKDGGGCKGMEKWMGSRCQKHIE